MLGEVRLLSSSKKIVNDVVIGDVTFRSLKLHEIGRVIKIITFEREIFDIRSIYTTSPFVDEHLLTSIGMRIVVRIVTITVTIFSRGITGGV